MTPLIVLMVVILVGLTSSPWNVTSAALTIAWAVPQMVWFITGDNMPIQIYAGCDVAVLGVLYCKPPMRGFSEARSAAIFFDMSIGDRIVALIFPIAWVFYVAPVNEWLRWQVLAVLVIVQFLAAGIETWRRLGGWVREHRDRFSLPPLWSYRMAGERSGVG